MDSRTKSTIANLINESRLRSETRNLVTDFVAPSRSSELVPRQPVVSKQTVIVAKPPSLETLMELFFQHYLVLKMYHFQTNLYGAHIASDAYLHDFLNLFDKFMEVAQGIYGKLNTRGFTLKVRTIDDQTIDNYLADFVDMLQNLGSILDLNSERATDLLNLRDEMLASANQLVYLLKFH